MAVLAFGLTTLESDAKVALPPFLTAFDLSISTGGQFVRVCPVIDTSLLDQEILDDCNEDRPLRTDESWDTESEAVRVFFKALTAQGTLNPRSTYRRSVVPFGVTEFLDEHDYLEDQHGASRINTTVRHADPPLTITLHKRTAEDIWGRPVIEEADLDEELVAFFERVLDSVHCKPALPTPNRWQYFIDEVPGANSDIPDEYESPPYYRLDGMVYSIIVG